VNEKDFGVLRSHCCGSERQIWITAREKSTKFKRKSVHLNVTVKMPIMQNALWNVIPEYQFLTWNLGLKQIVISEFVFPIHTEQTQYASGSWPAAQYCK